MTAQDTGGAGEGPAPATSTLDQMFRRKGFLAAIGAFGFLLTVGILETAVEPYLPGDVVDTVQVGGVRYELHFHRDARSYNTVRIGSLAVMDTRVTGSGLCLRLRAGADGRVEVECYPKPDVRRTEWLPLP